MPLLHELPGSEAKPTSGTSLGPTRRTLHTTSMHQRSASQVKKLPGMPGTGKLSYHSIRQAVDLFRRFLPDLGDQRLVGDNQVIPKNEDLPGTMLPLIELYSVSRPRDRKGAVRR